MTEMKRVTIAFPDEMDKLILQIKEREAEKKCSYSEIVRQLVLRGLAVESESA